MKSTPSQSDDWEAGKKKDLTNEYLSLLVVDLAVKKEKDETFEQQHIPPENISLEEPEELVENKEYAEPEILEEHEESFSEDEDDAVLPFQADSLLTPEEEASTWKDYKGALFDEYNNRETTIDKPKDDVKIPQHKIENEFKASKETSEDEGLGFSYRNRKSGATLADEYRESERHFSEQSGTARKKRLILLGLCLFLLIALIAASIPFIKSKVSDKIIIDTLNKSLISPDIDKNAYSKDVKTLSSDISPDVGSGYEEPNSITITDPNGTERIPDKSISFDLSQDAVVLGSVKSPLVSGDSEQAMGKSNVVNVITVSADSPDIIGIRKNEGQRNASANEARKTTSEVKPRKRPANNTRRASNGYSRTSAPISVRVGSSSPITFTGKELPTGADTAQEKIYSAIRSMNYIEAANLSKSSLEYNSTDKYSFFSLGLALYSMSDFSGATAAFYTCLKFNDSQLPNYLVEEFDSGEHLKNTYIDYPGIDLIIRAVELNPQNKSLYVNLFLSNLKSEKPRLASEIYQAVLNHAKKHGSNALKK